MVGLGVSGVPFIYFNKTSGCNQVFSIELKYGIHISGNEECVKIV